MKKTIMAVGAHGDDIEIYCGGTLAKYIADGYQGYYVQTTCSNSGYHCMVKGGGYDSSEKISSLRKKEMPKAAEVFGAEYYNFNFKEHLFTMEDGRQLHADIRKFPELEGQAVSGREPIVVACVMDKYIQEFAELIIEAEPEIIVTQRPDHNPDHYCTMLFTYNALQLAGKSKKIGPLYIRTELNEAMIIPIEPDFFVDVSGCEKIVGKAIKKHVTQCKYSDRITNIKQKWQNFADKVPGAKYVEAYKKIL